jgi:hypothetical protein
MGTEPNSDIITMKSTTKEPAQKTDSSIGQIKTGAIGITDKPAEAHHKEKVTTQSKTADVAIHSTRNVVWPGVGKVEKGYNIVSEAVSKQWLKRDHIRLVAPEELAREFGK